MKPMRSDIRDSQLEYVQSHEPLKWWISCSTFAECKTKGMVLSWYCE